MLTKIGEENVTPEGFELGVINKHFISESGKKVDKQVLNSPDWVVAIVYDMDLNIHCVKQFRAGVDAPLIEFPEGKVEKGESPLEAIIRELKEELGLCSEDILSIEKLLEGSPCSAYFGNTVHLFKVIVKPGLHLKANNANVPNEDDIEVVTINGDEVNEAMSSSLQNIYMKFLWSIVTPELAQIHNEKIQMQQRQRAMMQMQQPMPV
jgi:8-oxo-dGTP pyrophosphatase MutT (NUDIX family)